LCGGSSALHRVGEHSKARFVAKIKAALQHGPVRDI
jgi:hypothetical protein